MNNTTSSKRKGIIAGTVLIVGILLLDTHKKAPLPAQPGKLMFKYIGQSSAIADLHSPGNWVPVTTEQPKPYCIFEQQQHK